MFYDSEFEILRDCFAQETKNVLVLSGPEDTEAYFETINLYDSLCDSTSWIDNSKNTNMPPDIINEELKIYLEVMRFDDHSKNGKENPNRARASKMQEELFEKMPWTRGRNVFINAVTDLPTDEDHSYKMYLDGFKRTVIKHLNKLAKYDMNCPGYKKGFLVLDESIGLYYELQDKLRKDIIGTNKKALSRPHLYFFDKSFVDVFIESDLDYLIWYTPYKVDPQNLVVEMPKVVFYDIKNFKKRRNLLEEYKEPYMISNEI